MKLQDAESSGTSNPDRASPPFRGSILLFAAGAIGVALLLLVYYAVTWRSFAGFTKTIDANFGLFSDFVIYYYPMGEAIFHTGLPVSGYLYSPFIAILLAIFPPLGLTASLILWGILQALFVILYLLFFRRLVPAGLKIQLLFVALALSSYPLLLNLFGGQVSVFMVVAILGLLVLNERGRFTAGGGLLAFAVSFKFFPIFFIAPFAARRDARFLVFSAAACATLLFVVPGVLLGPGDTMRFYSALLDSFRESAWITANPHSQFFPHLFLRLSGMTGKSAHTLLLILHLISYGIAAANMGLIFLIQRARLRRADLWSFQLVFLTIPFVLKTAWPHDFVFLSFTQALMAWRLLEGKEPDSETDTEGKPFHKRAFPCKRSAVTLCLLLPSIFLSNIIFFNLFGSFIRYGSFGFIFLANLLLLIGMYVQFLPAALRKGQQPQAA